MRALAEVEGVSAFIYDELCANEKQRLQKRGLHPSPKRRIYINTDVCEGCGDCGEKSACLSVHPIDTILGRKTRIHQGTCAQDETCLEGDCPAFVTLGGNTAVAGLMVGEDIIRTIKNDTEEAGVYVIPDVALSGDMFIDDTPLGDVAAIASAPLVVAPATAAGLLGAAR